MNEFIKECRREWKRLRVPDHVADEMAGDLEADVEEAEADGVSREEVLGSDASDPRAFARSWAVERGVVPPRSRRSLALAGTAALTIIAAVGAALVLFASPEASVRTATLRLPAPYPTSIWFSTDRLPPAAKARLRTAQTILAHEQASRVRLTAPPPPSSFVFKVPQAQASGVDIHRVGSILLIAGVVGLILSMPLLFWSSRRLGTTRS